MTLLGLAAFVGLSVAGAIVGACLVLIVSGRFEREKNDA